MTEDQLREHIRRRCGPHWGGVSRLARELDVRPQAIHNVLGGRPITEDLAKRLGYRRVKTVRFVREKG